MVEEWPVAAPAAADRTVERARGSGGGRLRTAMLDFFLDPAERLTDQERALMTAMLYGLVGAIADELRIRVPDHLARASDCEPGALVGALSGASLLARDGLVEVLLMRADAARVAQSADGDGGRQLLSRLVSDADGNVAAAAMALALARGRRRDRVRTSVELNDLDWATAEHLIFAIAAELARRCLEADADFAAAAAEMLRRHDPEQGVHALEQRLVGALGDSGRLDDGFLLSLAARGEASLLAHALARLSGIPAADAWTMLIAPKDGELALLLRLAARPRTVAAGLLVAMGPAVGLHDAAGEIDQFDALSDEEVGARRRSLQLPAAYRRVAEALGSRG